MDHSTDVEAIKMIRRETGLGLYKSNKAYRGSGGNYAEAMRLAVQWAEEEWNDDRPWGERRLLELDVRGELTSEDLEGKS
jgi:hypothetical protein